MKKYLILLFILIQGLIFSATKSLSDIKTLRFDVVEKTNIKSKKREISYKIDFILPNKIKKEVIAPELNKGEIYIYDYSQNKKVVYLPMFNEVKETQIVDDENRIIKAINKIIEEQYKRAIEILTQNQEKLITLAELLLEREVIFKEDLETIFGKRPHEISLSKEENIN